MCNPSFTENKAKTRWDTMQSMIDAKCALKYLFELAVEIKKDAAMKEYTIEELEVNINFKIVSCLTLLVPF